jgi:hypothetical protein
MGGRGPMAGQANHFRNYAPEKIEYGVIRSTNEVNRLHGVMNKRLADRPFLAGEYSIADMACVGWVRQYEGNGQDLNDFPNLKRWFETLTARPAVQRGFDVGRQERDRSSCRRTRKPRKSCSTRPRAENQDKTGGQGPPDISHYIRVQVCDLQRTFNTHPCIFSEVPLIDAAPL